MRGVYQLHSILVAPGAPEAEALRAIGLQSIGATTRHAGMGTASTSFFFRNAYLQLFWVEDRALARQMLGSVGLDADARQRWRQTGASPFGLAVRRRGEASGRLPFSTPRLPATWLP